LNSSFNDGRPKPPERINSGERKSLEPQKSQELPARSASPPMGRRPSQSPAPLPRRPHKHRHKEKERKKKRRRAHKLTSKKELFEALLHNAGRELTKLTIQDIYEIFNRFTGTGLDSSLPRDIPMFRYDFSYEPIDVSAEVVARLASVVLHCPDLPFARNPELIEAVHAFRDKDVQDAVELTLEERERVVTQKEFSRLFEVLAYLLRVDEVYISTHIGWIMSGHFEPTDTLVALIIEEVAGKIVNHKELGRKSPVPEKRGSWTRPRAGSDLRARSIDEHDGFAKSMPAAPVSRGSSPPPMARSVTEPMSATRSTTEPMSASRDTTDPTSPIDDLKVVSDGESSSSSSSSSSSDTSASDWEEDELPDLDLLRVKFTYNDMSRMIWHCGLVDPVGKKGLPSPHLAFVFTNTCMQMPKLLEDRAEARPGRAKPPTSKEKERRMSNSSTTAKNLGVKGRTQFGILLEEIWRDMPPSANLNSPLNMCRHMLRTAREAQAEREAKEKDVEKGAKTAIEALDKAKAELHHLRASDLRAQRLLQRRNSR